MFQTYLKIVYLKPYIPYLTGDERLMLQVASDTLDATGKDFQAICRQKLELFNHMNLIKHSPLMRQVSTLLEINPFKRELF